MEAQPDHKEIAARAYRLWEAAGMPKDRDEEFWHEAEQQLRAEVNIGPHGMPDAIS